MINEAIKTVQSEVRTLTATNKRLERQTISLTKQVERLQAQLDKAKGVTVTSASRKPASKPAVKKAAPATRKPAAKPVAKKAAPVKAAAKKIKRPAAKSNDFIPL